MKLSEALLENYAKKILGFAYEKTGNSYDAEDLAQEIMVQLITCMDKETEIEYLSSYIYTVCCYTWSKYLRSNKKHWNYADIDEAAGVADDTDKMLEAENRLMYEKLRKIIATYAKTQREIIIMYYYENKTAAEISRILDINGSTVRWYLGNIKRDLKEKINMSSKNLDVRPVSLYVGIDGWSNDENAIQPLKDDLLVQNIAIACYGEPLEINQISEKLNVASAYLEKHIKYMVYMDFLKQTGKKYQTNFFIKTDEFVKTAAVYGYENAKPYADRIYKAVIARRDDINAINYFNREDVNENYFLWHILLKAFQDIFCEAHSGVLKELNITDRPLRKDGSKYWIKAGISYDAIHGINESLTEYLNYCRCIGYKTNMINLANIYQADTYFLSLCNMNFRSVSGDGRLMQFAGAIITIRDKYYNGGIKLSEFTEYEKVLISEFVEEGYISVKDNRPIINIPVLTLEEMSRLNGIIEEIKNEVGVDFLREYVLGFGDKMEPLIPSFLDKKLRNYHKYDVLGGFDMFGHIIKEAKEKEVDLEIPDEKAAKYAMSMIVLK